MSSVSSYIKNMHDQLDALLFPMLNGEETETELMRKTLKILRVFESHLRHIYIQSDNVQKMHDLKDKMNNNFKKNTGLKNNDGELL